MTAAPMPPGVPAARMPAIFFGHGSPLNALEHSRHTDAWQELGRSLPRPRAVLVVSAHWYTRGIAVTAAAQPRTIHDFSGFPRALHELQYPAPGDPALARRVQALLAPEPVELDESWGLDHGSWSVLLHLFPQADVPVVQLSLDATRPRAAHYRLAQRLAPLRDEGVLIIGTGNVVHNLRAARFGDDAPAYDWAIRFESTVQHALATGEHARLLQPASLGEDARLSVPTPEHFLPLLYIAALQQPGDTVTFPTSGIELGSISMLTVAYGLPDAGGAELDEAQPVPG
jgi:4,5-DOPA dioxygenase extradiol